MFLRIISHLHCHKMGDQINIGEILQNFLENLTLKKFNMRTSHLHTVWKYYQLNKNASNVGNINDNLCKIVLSTKYLTVSKSGRYKIF